MIGKILTVMIISANCIQSVHAASTWTKPSTWSDEESNTSRKTVRSREVSNTDLAPFTPGSNNLAIDLGQVFLMGNLSSKFNDSIGTQLHYTYGVSDLFGFDSSVGYSEHSNGAYSMATALTGLRMNLSWYDKVVPYAVFGLGFYRPYYKDGNVLQPTSASGAPTNISSAQPLSAVLFGIHLGPGVDLQLNKNLFFGAAVTFHNMFGSSVVLANGTQVSLGGSYTSFLLHLGATF